MRAIGVGACLMALASTMVLGQHSDAAAAALHVLVRPEVAVAGVRRIGLNLGTWTTWGAEQLSSNVLKNPGFEGLIDRAIVIVKDADQRGFSDDAAWLGRPDGFWAGARYEVRTGAATGQAGTLLDSRRAGRHGLPHFLVNGTAPALAPGDVIALTRVSDAELPTQWWIPADSRGLVTVELQDRRPHSPGRRAVALAPISGRDVGINAYLDAIAERAGKLLPLLGNWELSFWSRLSHGHGQLSVQLQRQGFPPFLSQTLYPTGQWIKTTYRFSPDDRGPPGTLELQFRSSGTGARILLDDVELRAVQSATFPFREEVLEALSRLRPGYLRDWQGQLGETLANRLAEPFARRASRYRPDGLEGTDFGYSLPEFLDLCRRAGANPWIIVPTTFSDDELLGLGEYLARRQRADRFDEILIEFGNENWNPTFRPSGIPDPIRHGMAADRAFQKIRAGALTPLPIRTVVNGQHANPPYALQFATHSRAADVLAVAPYVLPSLPSGMPQAQRLAQLFAADPGHLRRVADGLRPLQKEIASAEVNLHTLDGDASAPERDLVTTGAAAGSALANALVQALRLGAVRQCVYVLAGYDVWLNQHLGFAKLWGIVRDLTPSGRFRPTGLALMMLNRIIAGDLHQLEQVDSAKASGLTLAAFRSSAGWSAALISTVAFPQDVVIAFPTLPATAVPRQLLRLAAADPEAHNERDEAVRVIQEDVLGDDQGLRVRLPPWGLVVLLPPGEG